MVVAEINFSRKKVFFLAIYRSAYQSSEEFQLFIDKLQLILNYMNNDSPHSVIITGDLNGRSSQWWTEDIENIEGATLDAMIETNNMHQFIDDLRRDGMSCIDLIVTDQPNIFVESGVHPSLDEHCQHQVVYGLIAHRLSFH